MLQIRTILLSVQVLLGAPNPDDPLAIDIGKKWKDDEAAAFKTAMEWTRMYATPKPVIMPDEKSLAATTPEPAHVHTPVNRQAQAGNENGEGSANVVSDSPSPRALSKRPMACVTLPSQLHCDEVFEYSKLQRIDETRLLRLHPGSHDDEIVGTIEHVVLLTCGHVAQSDTHQLVGCVVCEKVQIPPYEALSYAWGNPKSTGMIYIHNPSSKVTQSMGIASNCAQALRQLRLVDEERVIWVDAICINQADLAERSAQVRIMHRIYRAASRVLIYLGDSSSDSDKAISILEDDANGDRPFITDHLNQAETEAVINLLNRDWFHRVWVLQEVAWSKSALVICGSRVTFWRETMHKAYSSSIGRIDRLQPLPYVMSFGEPKSSDPMTPEDMFRELRKARDCLSSDARDKIYALLELFQKRPDDRRLAIDYTRPLSDLYTDISEYLVDNMGIHILSEKFNSSSRSDLNQSWVIDWTVPSRFRPSEFRGCHAGRGNRWPTDAAYTPLIPLEEEGASDWMNKIRKKFHRYRLSHHPKSTKKLPLDPLQRNSPGQGESQQQQPGLNVRAAYIYPIGDIHLRFTPGHLSFESGLAQLLEWDSPANIPAFNQLLAYMAQVETEIEPPDFPPFEPKVGTPQDLSDFRSKWKSDYKPTKQVLSKLQNRVFLSTKDEQGHEGGAPAIPAFGPPYVKTGDKIFVLEGGDMCYVLRDTGKAGVYRLVGDCFLFGHMQMRAGHPIYRYCGLSAQKVAVPWEEITII